MFVPTDAGALLAPKLLASEFDWPLVPAPLDPAPPDPSALDGPVEPYDWPLAPYWPPRMLDQ
jgi:hypothetical protein